jgi:hypothetical protein
MKPKVVFFVTMVFLPALAFAQKNSANVALDQSVTIAGTRAGSVQADLGRERPECKRELRGGQEDRRNCSRQARE